MFKSTKRVKLSIQILLKRLLNLTDPENEIIRREREAHVIPFPTLIRSNQLISTTTAAARTRSSEMAILRLRG